MIIQIIAEGPTDREILHALIMKIHREIGIELIEESKTQMKRRGKYSILFQYSILAKFLHHGFSKSVDVIIICVDNDDEILDNSGIGSKKKADLKILVDTFLEKNNSIYPTIKPKWVLAVPVQTIDYWMKSIDERDNDCEKIRRIENIDRSNIKVETYGRSNVYGGWAIDQEAINSKIEKIKRESIVFEKLRCLPSFIDFENQLKISI
jgi:hypothetical protein